MGVEAHDLFKTITVYPWGDIGINISKGSAPIIDYSGPILNMAFFATSEGAAYLDAEGSVIFQSYSEYTPPYLDGGGYHPGIYTRSVSLRISGNQIK